MKSKGHSMYTDEEYAQLQILWEQFQETQVIPYPSNMGITGLAYTKKEIQISNNTKAETRFQNEIDNQTTQQNVKNYIIGPVFGH